MENIVRFIVTFVIVLAGLLIIPKIAKFTIGNIISFIVIRRGGKVISGYEKEFNPDKNKITRKCAEEFYKFSIVCRDVCETYVINHIVLDAFDRIDESKKDTSIISPIMPSEASYNNILKMYISICQFSAMYDPIMFDMIHQDEDRINSKPKSFKFAIALSKRYNSYNFTDAVMMHFTSVIMAFQKYVRDMYDDDTLKYIELVGIFDTVDKVLKNNFDTAINPDVKDAFLEKLNEQVEIMISNSWYADAFDTVYQNYIDEV